jgi:glycosyltransferase involved in cell wall biosynthesis
MTCYEASFYGMPQIVTDCGGPTEFVEHEVSGLIVPKGDVDAMGQAILKLANDGNQRAVMGQRAKMLIRKRIAEENPTKRYQTIYESF